MATFVSTLNGFGRLGGVGGIRAQGKPVPAEVQRVYDVLVKSARDAGMSQKTAEGRVYLAWEEGRYGLPSRWSLTDNYERVPATLSFDPKGQWYYRKWYSERGEYAISQQQAEAEAQLWFHG